MSLFSEMNEVYTGCLGEHRPAQTAVAVKGLPCGAPVEIECIADFAVVSHFRECLAGKAEWRSRSKRGKG